MHVVSFIDMVKKSEIVVIVEEIFNVETLAIVLMNFDRHGIEEYDEYISKLTRIGLHTYFKEIGLRFEK